METNDDYFIPYRAVHPTTILKDEIKARGISQKELAKMMEMKPSNLCRFLKGEDITIPIAIKLEEVLGIPAEDWVRMQILYQKDKKEIAIRKEKQKVNNSFSIIEKSIATL